MKISLRRISGEVYNESFDINVKIQDICSFLAKKLDTASNQIFIINPEKNKNLFYQDCEYVRKITNKKHKYLLFIQLAAKNSNTKSNYFNDKYCQKPLVFPTSNAMYVFNNLKNIKYIGFAEYSKYAKIIRNEPKDFDNRINKLLEIGYDINDCKEALRKSDYNVEKAGKYLADLNNVDNSYDFSLFNENSFSFNLYSDDFSSSFDDQKTHGAHKQKSKLHSPSKTVKNKL